MKKWNVEIKRKVGKKLLLLPESVRSAVFLLKRDLEMNGPSTGGAWKNFSKLTGVKGDNVTAIFQAENRLTCVVGK